MLIILIVLALQHFRIIVSSRMFVAEALQNND